MCNVDDDQGLMDRWVFVSSSQNFDADDEINNPFEEIEADDEFDVYEYLSIINKEHQVPRIYTLSKDGEVELLSVRKELRAINELGHRRFGI